MDHDLLVIGSDSGRVVILEYNVDTRHFSKVHEETFGKTGCRRVTPGASPLTQANTSPPIPKAGLL